MLQYLIGMMRMFPCGFFLFSYPIELTTELCRMLLVGFLESLSLAINFDMFVFSIKSIPIAIMALALLKSMGRLLKGLLATKQFRERLQP